MRRWSTAVLAVLAGTSTAHAAPEVVELRYAAPPGCPARGAFETAILERTPNVRLGAPARRVFDVTIETVPDGFRGRVAVDRVADKELAAPGCDELATALALVTALAIDPTAAAVRATPAEAWSFEADLDAMVEAGVGPDAMPAAVLEARASPRRRYPIEVAAIVGRDSASRAGAEARFTWFAGRIALCRRWFARAFAIDGCAHGEAGAVRAHGAMIVNQRDLTRLWLAAGVHGSARYPLDAQFFGLLQVGLSLPFVRDRYLFAPNDTIHETPAVTGWLLVGVGMRFL
jgi:hypothetical protein